MKLQLILMLTLFILIESCHHNNKIDYCSLNLKVGNGFTIHPVDGTILISKPSGKILSNGKTQYSIYKVSTDESGLPLYTIITALNSKYTDYHPVFSPDGNYLLFNSTRPKPNTTLATDQVDIWYVTYDQGDFGIPFYLDSINTDFHDSYPTITSDHTIYFNSDRPGGKGSMDIYKSYRIHNTWTQGIPVKELNSEHSENDLFIDPNERFIIFNRYNNLNNEIDLFLSQSQHKTWLTPTPLTKVNRANVWELTPTIYNKQLLLEIDGVLVCIENCHWEAHLK